jgi:phosphopantothenoylcysteine decarboxylase/phosphopantothenate--cysteine ligase
VLVTAGPTHEPVDPVRFLGNRSSGKMGFALAAEAVRRGARTILVAGPVALPTPSGATRVDVTTAREMERAVHEHAGSADLIVMAAAVADFRPSQRSASKVKKTDRDPEPIGLVRNPDILAEISADRRREGQVIVGFAAETDDVLTNGRKKLAAKGCDLMVVNEVGEHRTFDAEHNSATILGSDGGSTVVPEGSKEDLGHAILDLVVERLQ